MSVSGLGDTWLSCSIRMLHTVAAIVMASTLARMAPTISRASQLAAVPAAPAPKGDTHATRGIVKSIDGTVLVAGGTNLVEDTAELYDPATETWSLTGSLNVMRKDHAATLLLNGMVLVSGGALAHKSPLASAELYDPGIVPATRVEGQGSFENEGDSVTFSLRATQAEGTTSTNFFSFCDPAAGVCLVKAGIGSISINGNTAECKGTARLNDDERVTYTVNVTDNGAGTRDTISISLSDGYFASGNLTSGNIRIY